MDTNTFFVTDELGNEIEMEILFTFQPDNSEKKYVLYTDPRMDDGSVMASLYDDEGNLSPVETEAEWEMIEEVLSAFIEDEEDAE
ncbi:MAG: DUF1292 domain-containing protein [Erysipelotrichaceae bacterium]|nr:DUF1292 domain-containing protein [Erysipelotrichaceae bacterium]